MAMYCPVLAAGRYTYADWKWILLLILCYTLRQHLVLSTRNNRHRKPFQEFTERQEQQDPQQPKLTLI